MQGFSYLRWMLQTHSLSTLLWRLRKESALYLFGAGASAPVVPLAPSLLLETASSYVRLGSIPVETAPRTELTERVLAQSYGYNFSDRQMRPGTDQPPYMEILARLGHGGALAQYMHLLAIPRYAEWRIPNYIVLRLFQRSLLITWNLDGLAKDTCCDWHRVIEAHGGVPAGYGSAVGGEWARATQEHRFEVADQGLHPIGLERLDDLNLQHALLAIQQCAPAFILIVGYSFGLFEGYCDDYLSIATIVNRFRDVPIDVFICDPQPQVLAEMLRAELRSDRIHVFPVYWNVLAWAFIQAIFGKIDLNKLHDFHESLLDARGPCFMPLNSRI